MERLVPEMLAIEASSNAIDFSPAGIRVLHEALEVFEQTFRETMKRKVIRHLNEMRLFVEERL